MVNSIDVRRGNEQVRQDNPGIYAKIRNAVVIAVLAAMGGAFGHSYVSENKAKDAQVSPLVSNEALKIKMLFLLGETERLVQCTFPGKMLREARLEALRNLHKTHDLSNEEHAEILLREMEKVLVQRQKEMLDLCEHYNKMDAQKRLQHYKNIRIEVQEFLTHLNDDIEEIGSFLKYIRRNMTRKMV